jgi:hypothetical protein
LHSWLAEYNCNASLGRIAETAKPDPQKKPGRLIPGNPAISLMIIETRGFPSPSHGEFGLLLNEPMITKKITIVKD